MMKTTLYLDFGLWKYKILNEAYKLFDDFEIKIMFLANWIFEIRKSQ